MEHGGNTQSSKRRTLGEERESEDLKLKKRKWNSHEEVVFLRELGECSSKKVPKLSIFQNVKNHLGGKYSDTQLDNKMKKLKVKFRNLKKKKNEPGFSFKNARDEELYKLALKAWGSGNKKIEKEEKEVHGEEEEKEDEDEENDDKKSPLLKEMSAAKPAAANMCTPLNQADWESMKKCMEKNRNDMLAGLKEMLKGVGQAIICSLQENDSSTSFLDFESSEEMQLKLKRLKLEALDADVTMKRMALKKEEAEKKILHLLNG